MSMQGSFERTTNRIRYTIENSRIFKTKTFEDEDRDLDLIYSIQPTGGMKPYDDLVRLGDSFMTCISVNEAPDKLTRNWMFQLCKRQNVITTIDIETLDKQEVKDNLDRALSEQDSRLEDAKKRSQARDAVENYRRLDELLDEVSLLGSSMKALRIRMFVYAPTYDELARTVRDIFEELKASNYGRYSINLGETIHDCRSFFLPTHIQNNTVNERKGLPCPANIAAFGIPFHYLGWKDKHGFYFGNTPEEAGYGPVFFDPFVLDKYRTCYDGFAVGDKGSGKSTTLKMIIEQVLCTGNKVRIIDVTSEFNDITRKYGGIVIKLDGSDDRLNPLEILRMDESETTNYMKHISKMGLMLRLKSPDATDDVIDLYKTLLNKLYAQFGILNPNEDYSSQKITGLKSEAYPIFSDLLKLIENEIDNYEEIAEHKESAKQMISRLVSVKIIIEDIVRNYGSIFDRHTNIANLMDADIIDFDIKSVSDMEPAVYDMQLFNVLSIAYDSCMTIGTDMKHKHDNGEIPLEDIIHHFIFVDECHKSINSRKKYAIERMLDIMRQDRKYFIGVWLATQKITDMFPETGTAAAEDIKALFSMCQYKLIFKQSNDAVNVLEDAFGKLITDNQRAMVPTFKKRELLLNLGVHTIQMTCKQVGQNKLKYYGGGA